MKHLVIVRVADGERFLLEYIEDRYMHMRKLSDGSRCVWDLSWVERALTITKTYRWE